MYFTSQNKNHICLERINLDAIDLISRTTNKKMPISFAENALIESEEAVMATFDFLGSEREVDEDEEEEEEENLR